MGNMELQVKFNDAIVKVVELENEIRLLKQKEEEYKIFKKQLYEIMTEIGATSYETPNGVKFVRVSPTSDKTEIVIDFDIEKFKKDNPLLYKDYVVRTEKTTKGKDGYIRVYAGKGEIE